jgi:lipoprotein-anchoring transpeptidase ErfK/SrfK
MWRVLLSIAVLALLIFDATAATGLSIETVNSAAPSPKRTSGQGIDPLTIKMQVLLDRAHFSPGEIDGKLGENLKKAIRAYASSQGMASEDRLTDKLWGKLSATSADPVMKEYTITVADLKGPFVDRLPSRLEEMKGLPALGYRNPKEALAERFHMSEELLVALNPTKKFETAGETIFVTAADNKIAGRGSRIEIDKAAATVKVFDESGRLLAVYPATIGSDEKPAPSGTLRITSISHNPTYRYDPEYKFKGVKSAEPFTIQPGPNNPVGTVWIGLSAKGYGIHGTPHPDKVSKSESNGCVRLTNWDAEQVASVVRKGVPVIFLEGTKPVVANFAAKKASTRTKGHR